MNLGPPTTFVCPKCNQERTGVRKRCYECTKTQQTPESIAKTRQANLGRKASEEHRRKNSDWHKAHTSHYFDLGATTRGKPPHNWLPVGAEREGNGHIQAKCSDGKWRNRARVMWVQVHGPISKGTLIHHINGDPFDDRMENFQAVTRAEHARIHATPETMREKGRKGLAQRGYNLTG